MKLWILVIATTHGQTIFGTNFASYEECNKQAIKISSGFIHATPSCRKKRPFIP